MSKSSKRTKPTAAMAKACAEIRECVKSVSIELNCTDVELIQDPLSLDELITSGNAIANAAQSIDETPWCERTITKGGAK